MRKVALSEVEGHLPEYLRIAEDEEVVITRNGEPAGVLIGFRSAEDWADYQLENDPRFLRRIEESRRSFEAGRGVQSSLPHPAQGFETGSIILGGQVRGNAVSCEEIHHLADGDTGELGGLAQGGVSLAIPLQGKQHAAPADQIPNGCREILLLGLGQAVEEVVVVGFQPDANGLLWLCHGEPLQSGVKPLR